MHHRPNALRFEHFRDVRHTAGLDYESWVFYWLVNQLTMPRPSNTDARRRQICRALLSVMAKKGFDGATVADIANFAGLTPGLVHYHFANKLEILTALIDQLATRHHQRLTDALASAGPDPRRQLGTFVDTHLSLDAAEPDAVAVWTALTAEALRSHEVRHSFQTALSVARAPLTTIIQRGADEGYFTPNDVAAATACVLAIIQGYLALASTTEGLIPTGSAATEARRAAAGLMNVSIEVLES